MAGISRALAKPERAAMASPPLTYAVLGLAGLTFILSGFNGLMLVLVLAIFQPLAIALTVRDPDVAYVWFAWIFYAKFQFMQRSVVRVR